MSIATVTLQDGTCYTLQPDSYDCYRNDVKLRSGPIGGELVEVPPCGSHSFSFILAPTPQSVQPLLKPEHSTLTVEISHEKIVFTDVSREDEPKDTNRVEFCGNLTEG